MLLRRSAERTPPCQAAGNAADGSGVRQARGCGGRAEWWLTGGGGTAARLARGSGVCAEVAAARMLGVI